MLSCKERVTHVATTSKRWRHNNLQKSREYSRNRNLLKKYGITATEWDILFISQGSCCAACKTQNPGSKMGWHTDHKGALPCTKDKIRGILCLSCNHAAKKGTAADVAMLRSLADYLERAL